MSCGVQLMIVILDRDPQTKGPYSIEDATPLPDTYSWDTNPFLMLQNPPVYPKSVIGHFGQGPYIAVNFAMFQGAETLHSSQPRPHADVDIIDLITLSSKAGQIAGVVNQLCTAPGDYTPAWDEPASSFATATPVPFTPHAQTPHPAEGAPRAPRKRVRAAVSALPVVEYQITDIVSRCTSVLAATTHGRHAESPVLAPDAARGGYYAKIAPVRELVSHPPSLVTG